MAYHTDIFQFTLRENVDLKENMVICLDQGFGVIFVLSVICASHFLVLLTFFLLVWSYRGESRELWQSCKQHMNRCLWMINVLLFLTSKEKCASTPPPPSPNPPLLSSSELLCRPGVSLLLCACSPPVCSFCLSLSCGGKPATRLYLLCL